MAFIKCTAFVVALVAAAALLVPSADASVRMFIGATTQTLRILPSAPPRASHGLTMGC